MTRVKIIGAGSIGNHLAHAARRLDWSVVVCDVDRDALSRMREDIFPERYGSWDPEIQLYSTDSVPKGDFDAIFIGTPPESHLPLGLDALGEEPRVILIEKPVCPPTLEQLQEFAIRSRETDTTVLVGYNHVVGLAARHVDRLVQDSQVGAIQTIDVSFREHWGGIFRAHPWLRGPADSYLGFWTRGGGAGGEHSHGLNLWQHFARTAKSGRIVEVDAALKYADGGKYDSICAVNLRTEDGFLGRVIQDVLSLPPRKTATVQGSEGRITWMCGHDGASDAVAVKAADGTSQTRIFEKSRSDDFVEELKVVENVLAGGDAESLSFERAAETALVLHAAHRSEQEKTKMSIDYHRGYTRSSVQPTRNRS